LIRAFLALELNESDTIHQIREFSKRLKKNQSNLKTVEPENLHITVKFLGNIPEEQAPSIYYIIKEEINEKLFHGRTLEYTLKGVGQFRNYSVIWIKLIGDIEFLQNLKDRVEILLYDKLKIQKDKRKEFKPHLTIGRLRKERIDYKTLDALKKIINNNKQYNFGPFYINQLKLKKSDLTPQGPIYSDLVF
jgi:2'-5' RNA ligase